MPTVTKETGAGLANSNSYASVADGDAYAASRLYSSSWVNATQTQKEQAVIMASRTIDQEIQFNGYKQSQQQAMQWPRRLCPDPDSDENSVILGGGLGGGPYLPENTVPSLVVQATCETALQLLKSDRTGDAQGQGIKRVSLEGAVEVEFAEGMEAPLPITRDALHMLSKYGQAIGAQSGVVKLVRV